jgi:hypothetical protein
MTMMLNMMVEEIKATMLNGCKCCYETHPFPTPKVGGLLFGYAWQAIYIYVQGVDLTIVYVYSLSTSCWKPRRSFPFAKPKIDALLLRYAWQTTYIYRGRPYNCICYGNN